MNKYMQVFLARFGLSQCHQTERMFTVDGPDKIRSEDFLKTHFLLLRDSDLQPLLPSCIMRLYMAQPKT